MTQTKRFLYQVLFWLIIWLSQWLSQGTNSTFLTDNATVYIFQTLLIGILIYFTAPNFLLKKKYLIFGSISIGIIILFSLFTISDAIFGTELPPPRHTGGPGPHHQAPFHRGNKFIFSIFPPSRAYINFLLLTVAYFLSTFFEVFIYLKKKEEETILSKTENLETELKLLKSQINPHFLFNALNNIYALSAINTEKTQESISYLSNMLRYVLYECDQKLVPLEKEILYIENYIKLFSLKSSKKYPIKFISNISNYKTYVAPMLFIPFVENAFKHSNIERGLDSFIHIEVSVTDENKINFIVKNSMPKQNIVKDTVGGIGLLNVKKRLSILYPEKHSLNIYKDKDIYGIKLTIQLDKND